MALLQLPKLHLLKQEARGEAPGGAAMWKAYGGASGMTKTDWRPEVTAPSGAAPWKVYDSASGNNKYSKMEDVLPSIIGSEMQSNNCSVHNF